MGRNFINLKQFFRLIILFAVILGNAFNKTEISTIYIFVFLFFILNSQLRVNLLKSKAYTFSTLLDLILLFYINTSYASFNYLLFYIPLLDNISYNKYFSYIMIPVILYYSYNAGFEIIALNFIIIILMLVFADQLKRLQDKIEEIEEIYDKNRKYSYQLERAKKNLEDYSKKVESLAQLEERSRISIEIHDSIGHKLTALLMQMEAILIIKEKDPSKAEEMLLSSRDLIKNCVELLRATVKNIKPQKHRRGVLLLVDFLQDFSKETGVNTNFNLLGNPYDLLPGEITALYKNLQEAVTNALRHGRSNNIEVTLEYSKSMVIMTVKDDGAGCNKLSKGMGLTAMEDRVALFGGSIKINTDNKGFSISTALPVHEGRSLDED